MYLQGDNVPERSFHGAYNFKAQCGESREKTVNHIHDYLQIWYVIKGYFLHFVDGRPYRHSAGEMLILPPYVPHQLDTRVRSDDLLFTYCEVSENFLNVFPEGTEKSNLFYLTYLRPLSYNAELSPFLKFTGDDARQIENIYMRLVAEWRKEENLNPTYVRTDLIRLFSYILQKYRSMFSSAEETLYDNYQNALERTLSYIDGHFTEVISVEQACSIALMSPRSFSHIFKGLTGQTLVEYINTLRIRMAAELLESSHLSASEAGLQCGYSDPTYFGKIFKRLMGMSPKQYQLKHNNTKK